MKNSSSYNSLLGKSKKEVLIFLGDAFNFFPSDKWIYFLSTDWFRRKKILVVHFDDIELGNDHTVSVLADSGNIFGGTLTAAIIDPALGTGDGNIKWTYTLSNAMAQQAAAHTYQESFTILIDDGHGGITSQIVTVGVHGRNDAPIAILSQKPQLIYNYFKQLFAQVTNPPLDGIREKLITDISLTLGSDTNIFKINELGRS